jgi:hypothetical protein
MGVRVSGSGPWTAAGFALGALLVLAGCYTRLVSVDGSSPPIPLPEPEQPFASAGILLDEDSVTPPTAFFTAEDVAGRFALRIAREGVFAPVLFPYPRPDAAEPEVVLGVTVRMQEDYHYAGNVGKALLHGFTVLLTLPLLPFRVGFAVDLSVASFDARRAPVATYTARSEYDLFYSWLELPRDAEDAWLVATADHAIEDVVNQLKRDYGSRSLESVRAGRSAAWRTK